MASVFFNFLARSGRRNERKHGVAIECLFPGGFYSGRRDAHNSGMRVGQANAAGKLRRFFFRIQQKDADRLGRLRFENVLGIFWRDDPEFVAFL
jgi:hypothetical protein